MIKLGNSNPKIKELKSMISNNKIKDLVITDDLTVLELAYNKGLEIVDFIFVEETIFQKKTNELIENIKNYAANTYIISADTYKKMAQKENKIGILGTIKIKNYSLLEMTNCDYLVVSDSLEIPGNLGTIYRSLDSANVDGLLIVDPITKPNNSKVVSSSRGANLLIKTSINTYQETVNWLIENNYQIYLAEPNLGYDYKYYSYSDKIAIVIGNERFGINSNWYNNPHKKVYIPMYGVNNSLNVGVAASIIIFEAMMKRLEKKL